MVCYSLHAKCSENVWYLADPYVVLHFHRGFSLENFLLPFLHVPHEFGRSVITTVLHIPLPYCSSSFCCAFSFLFGRLCWSSLTPQPLHCPIFHITCYLTPLSSHFLIFLVQVEWKVIYNSCLHRLRVNSLATVLQNMVVLVQLPKLSEEMTVHRMSRALRLSWYTP